MRQERGTLLNRTRHIKVSMPSQAVDKRRSGAERDYSSRPPYRGGTQGCHVESSARGEECRDTFPWLDVDLHREGRLTLAVEEHGNHLSPV